MVAISFDADDSALEVLGHVRAMRADLPVFVRTEDDANLEAFQKAGATEVVPEILEGSLMLASHLLLTLGVSPAKIVNKIREVHSDRYAVMRCFYKGYEEANSLEVTEVERRSLQSIVVVEGAGSIGKTLRDILPQDLAVEEAPAIKTVVRGEERINDPDLGMVIEVHDVIVAFATPEEVYLLEENILAQH
jgi:CPA2 family monovalent cation:H+ antiporter-2